MVLINDSEKSSSEVKAVNEETLEKLQQWKLNHDNEHLIVHPVYVPSVDARHAGAGMARKIGMDEIVRRFSDLDRPDGVIVSLDADCLVSENYLQVIEKTFASAKSCFAATLNFSHRIDEVTDSRLRQGIRFYEDYLHYYKRAHDYTGFPNSIYTIGSAFAVRADAYIKQGGMNRRQAGEDFYFLNKLTSLGKLNEIANVFVYPSARTSDRVPFGTGAAMTKWMKSEDDLSLTYNFAAFADLKTLFDQVDLLYRIAGTDYQSFKSKLPRPILRYMQFIHFDDKLMEINQNSSSSETFRKRFFQFFDAFVIMRFLNISHQDDYPQQDLYEAIGQLNNYLAHILPDSTGHFSTER